MAAKEKTKEKEQKIEDKDHPSLCEVGGQIRLRVLEDFFIERELPKWKRFQEEWDKFKKGLGVTLSNRSPQEVESQIKSLNKTDEEKEALLNQAKNLIAMDKAVQDDRWDIRGKHEREVDASILKQAKFVTKLTFMSKVKGIFRKAKRKPVPVEIAMADLFDHIELTSTPELAARMDRLMEIEAGMRKAGQYKKADTVKQLRAIVAEEAVVVKAGFKSYVSEDTMIEFLRKSERGTMVEFLRYYEDEIPPEAIEKKCAADALMVFDNYVVAHYSDLIQKAVRVEKKQTEKEEKKQREKRRDPILFGLIKNSRKLYYICDWKTNTDDLTLEKLEKELGVTRGSLVAGAETAAQATRSFTYEDSVGADPVTEARMRHIVYSAMNDAMTDIEEDRLSRSYSWSGGSMAVTSR